MSQILSTGGGGGGSSVTVVPYTSVETTPYVVLNTDYYMGINNSAPTTILLPDAPAVGRVFTVKDTFGSLGMGLIYTITTVSGITQIDSVTNFEMNNNFQSASFIFNGTSYEVF